MIWMIAESLWGPVKHITSKYYNTNTMQIYNAKLQIYDVFQEGVLTYTKLQYIQYVSIVP